MAGAGYNPVAMANFFELLRSEQGRDPGKLERFFSDHPPSADREARIREQATSLQLVRANDVGGFDRMRADLRRLSPAPSQVSQRLEAPNPDSRNPNTGQFDVRVAEPSSRFQRFQQPQGLFTIDHPDNWKAYAAESGYAVSMAPDGGVVDTGGGQQAMLYGVIVNHYEPFENESGPPAGKSAAPLRAHRGHGPVARKPVRCQRRSRSPAHPVELVFERRGRLSSARARRRSVVPLGRALRPLARYRIG